VKQYIASQIIELASDGERNPDVLGESTEAHSRGVHRGRGRTPQWLKFRSMIRSIGASVLKSA
jgi:hypothetical protein